MADTEDTELLRQMAFLKVADRLKQVIRRSNILDGTRRENSAEHSWHFALTVMTLAKHAKSPVDVGRVIKMAVLHDLPEIFDGDVVFYDQGPKQEVRYADHPVFAELPTSQREEFGALVDEFERGDTADARFARAIDRIWPIIQNTETDGGVYLERNLSHSFVVDRNKHIGDGAPTVWEYILDVLEKAVERGYVEDDRIT